jgi:DNA-binding transcriptional MocR family regulator
VESTFAAGTQLVRPRGGYMLWAELPGLVDFAALRTQARANGIAFAAGDVFFAGSSERSCVRLNCAKASEEQLVQGIETLGGLIRGMLG